MVICSKGCPLGHGQLRGCLRGSTVTLREAEPAWVQTLEVGDAFTSMDFNESHIGNVCIYMYRTSRRVSGYAKRYASGVAVRRTLGT